MSESNPSTGHFDVFLCHNSEDKQEIREIADALACRGLKPWLDERDIRPGSEWQKSIALQIQFTKAAAVFIGKSGVSPFQDTEVQSLMNRFMKKACRIIPVILASAPDTPRLPILLETFQWVDFRKTKPDPLARLIWGITGKEPGPEQNHSARTQVLYEMQMKDLLPSKPTHIIELCVQTQKSEISPDWHMTVVQTLRTHFHIEGKIASAVPGSLRLELTQDDADKLCHANNEGQLEELPLSAVRLYPTIAIPPDQAQRAQLETLLDLVQEYWIDGVLTQSLQHEVAIVLRSQAMNEAVEPPWRHGAALATERRHLLLQDRTITSIFEATGLLLVLGEPGSGKTTSLLELAKTLILKAKKDSKERVPIVLNLSSWLQTQSLEEWIATELSAKYHVPKTIARAWLTEDYLVPLLDGLDEVHTAIQPECVAAINAFIRDNQPSGLVVCSRLTEYQWLPERLALNGAVCLEPLSHGDVNRFLEAGGELLAGLQQAISHDPVLRELSQTPLMLSIMSLACEGSKQETLTSDQNSSPEVRREHILQLYVERMFERKGLSTSPYRKDEIIDWLSWLARKMKEQSLSVFMVESLQPLWLSSKGQRWAYEVVAALKIGVSTSFISDTLQAVALLPLVFLLSSGLVFDGPPELSAWLSNLDYQPRRSIAYGILIGLSLFLGCRSTSVGLNAFTSVLISLPLGASVFTFEARAFTLGAPGPFLITIAFISGMLGWFGIGLWRQISLVETVRWETKRFFDKARLSFMKGLLRGFFVALCSCLLFYAVWDWGVDSILLSIILAVMYGLLCGLVYGWISGLLAGLVDGVREDKTFPNQGIILSRRNGLVSALIGLLISGAIMWPLAILVPLLMLSPKLSSIVPASASEVTQTAREIYFLSSAPIFVGVLLGFSRGGSSVMKHYALRLILWLNGSTPLRFIPFLDDCTRLVFLKKVGGGYIFIHRTLLDYFAGLSHQTPRTSSREK